MKNISILIFSFFIISCGMFKSTQKKGEVANASQALNDFSKDEESLILEKDTSQPMRVLLITDKTDSLFLRKKSEDVYANPEDSTLRHFVKRLYRTVTDELSMGVGIAAPQVGLHKNIIWVQRFDKEGFPFEVYLNPRIIQYSKKKQECPEGCLSIPNFKATTLDRAYAILIEYDSMDGSHHTEMVEEFTAVIFQHEIDHLNGILFIDHKLKKKK